MILKKTHQPTFHSPNIRPIGRVRVGILTIAEKWKSSMVILVLFQHTNHYHKKFATRFEDDNLWVNGAICPDEDFFESIGALQLGEGLRKGTKVLAYRTREHELPEIISNVSEYTPPITLIDQTWKDLPNNGAQLRNDFHLLTKGRTSQPIEDPHTKTYYPEKYF